MSFSRLFAAALAATLIGAPAPAQQRPAESLAAERVRGHVEFLSSDLLEGRDTGSRGHEIAASYVAAEFRKLGLKPGGTDGGWYVQVPFRRASHVGVPTATLVRNGRRVALVSGRDFGLRPSLTEKDRTVDAGLVFVGHGISDPRLGIDEYAGLDVRGKIVVALEGSPSRLPSDVGAHIRSWKEETAAGKGAVGIIEIGSPRPGPRPAASAERQNRPLLSWVDAGGRAGSAGVLKVDIALSPDAAANLFEGAPRSLSQLQSQVGKGPIAGFALPGRLQVRAQSQWQDFTSPEVVGILPGSDLALAQDFVLLTGHLDHLGVKTGAKPGEDAIYNGAIDNAGGVATMLEAARSFVLAGAAPRRSVMFIAHTGEEKGLLGADYLAANPTVPVERMVGLVNLDMPLLLYPFTDVIAFGAEHSTLAPMVASAAASMGVTLSDDPMPEQSLFVRSDHYPFVRQGVPSVFLMTGHANGGKPVWDKFLSNDYHSVKDDVSQAIDWEAGARFAELNYRIARALADAPDRPRWYRDSYFGQAFAPAQAKAAR